MPNPRLASRYAKSLIDIAVEKNQLEAVFADIQWLQAACKSSRELVNLLRSPIIKADAKRKILDSVTAGKIGIITNAFTSLLINKGREGNLPEIMDAFIDQYKKKKDIHTLKLTTTSPISEALKQAIVDHVKNECGLANIELETKTDEKLIGGFILQVEDKLVDASIAYDLKAIARQFENNDFIYNVR